MAEGAWVDEWEVLPWLNPLCPKSVAPAAAATPPKHSKDAKQRLDGVATSRAQVHCLPMHGLIVV